jgi:hypothetical protein
MNLVEVRPNAPPSPHRAARSTVKRIALKLVLSLASLVLTALILDGLLIATGLLAPNYRVGDAVLGFAPSRATEPGGDRSELPELADDPVCATFHVNSAGFMSRGTMDEFLTARGPKIVALGDSHTALEYCFDRTHMGVLETALQQSGFPHAAVLGAGKGRYSPLQEWLLFDERLRQLPVDAVVMNFYTGNDFYDLIRTDDRPSLVADPEHGYRIVPPNFVIYLAPDDHGYRARSRMVYGSHLLLRQVGLEDAWAKFQHARSACDAFGVPLSGSWQYMWDLSRSRDEELWYSAAVAAQALNQALFFHHFPGALEESLSRTRFVLEQMRTAYPTHTLVLSPIPSRLLARPAEREPASERIFSRLPLDRDDAVAQELECYEALLDLGRETGWHVLDTLPKLREAAGDLYFDSDWHLAPAGSEVIGTAQAETLSRHPEWFD